MRPAAASIRVERAERRPKTSLCSSSPERSSLALAPTPSPSVHLKGRIVGAIGSRRTKVQPAFLHKRAGKPCRPIVHTGLPYREPLTRYTPERPPACLQARAIIHG